MSESIFETFTDERGNISVRISQEVQVLTREEANRIEAEYRRMQADNAKLRELVRDMYRCSDPCNDCPHYNGSNSGFYCGLGIGWKARRMHELGVEVDV